MLLWSTSATRGPCSYTTLNTTREFARREPETLTAMCRAMYRTQQWIAANDGRALAKLVGEYFPDVPEDTLAACYDDYRKLGVWNGKAASWSIPVAEFKNDAIDAVAVILQSGPASAPGPMLGAVFMPLDERTTVQTIKQ